MSTTYLNVLTIKDDSNKPIKALFDKNGYFSFANVFPTNNNGEWGVDEDADNVYINGNTVTFTTENGTPLPIAERLAELNPTASVSLDWSSEDCRRNQGKALFECGYMTERIDYFPGTPDAFTHYGMLRGMTLEDMADANIITDETLEKLLNGENDNQDDKIKKQGKSKKEKTDRSER